MPGCSIRRYAFNKAANIVAQSGTTFSSDDDPDLVRAAVPFSLKLTESFLANTPKHVGLLTAATSGFTRYAYAFVQQDADELEPTDLAAADILRARARRLYLRAHRYGMRALEVQHPGFGAELLSHPAQAAVRANKMDVPLLYWTAVAWGGAISLSKDNPELLGQIPAMEALIERALELNESYSRGAIHTFLITYEMSKPGAKGAHELTARKHFDRAVTLSKETDPSPFVALAEAVTVGKQDAQEFESSLNRALAIDADKNPANRVVTLVMQRRARWLLSRKDELFLAK